MLKSHKLDDRPFKGSQRHTFGWLTLKRKLLNSERLNLRRKDCEKSSFDRRQQVLQTVYVSVPKKKKKACCQNHELNVSSLSLTHHNRVTSLENGTLKKKPCSHSHHLESPCHPTVPDSSTIARTIEKQHESHLDFKQEIHHCDKIEELDEDEGWFSREASEASERTSCQVNTGDILTSPDIYNISLSSGLSQC